VVTEDELKKALDGSNFESSSGWDGVSFRVIRKIWEMIKHPMLKMIRETFEVGELMESFKLGLIRLIPKKGDASKVGDWRPITLLCCGYKLISGIVANWLERYLHKIIGRAQKGFMRSKNINTCTVNIMNSITKAWNMNKPTGIMCVDFSKAFDSVEHKMIGNVLEYFGFGIVLQRMVMTLLRDRKSRVILVNGYSETINIGRGTPQGDRSSPYIFILCIEVLLIRLRILNGWGIDDAELFVEMIGVDQNNVEPMTGEAYADDLTIIFKMSEMGVAMILELLREFDSCSGLSINISKTQLMVVGTDNWGTGERILGVNVVDKVKILGVTLDRKLDLLSENWDRVITKMGRLARYWGTFGLSIAGRVMVTKTFLMSQAVYLMGIMPLTEDHGDAINEIMLNFVKGNDRLIERRRQLLCAKLGGYGLVDAKIMSVCMKVTWMDRWKREADKPDMLALIMWNGNRDIATWKININGIINKGLPIMEEILKA
jgi:hypothetical protein